MKTLPLAAALAATLSVLAACGPAPELRAEDGVVQLPAVPGSPAAAYFTLRGGAEDNALIAVSTTVALRAEIHETMSTGTMSGMRPVARVPVPAEGSVAFAPGGLHVMLFGLNDRAIEVEGGVPLVLTFERGPAIRYVARTRPVGSTG